jgi:type I restriction enzyme M protein
MAISLDKPRLDNLANEIWKSAERLRGKFKAYEYQNVILPMIVTGQSPGVGGRSSC